MTLAAPTPSRGKTQEQVTNEGYQAQAAGQNMSDNPYSIMDPNYWLWRKGFIEAFKDSN